MQERNEKDHTASDISYFTDRIVGNEKISDVMHISDFHPFLFAYKVRPIFFPADK